MSALTHEFVGVQLLLAKPFKPEFKPGGIKNGRTDGQQIGSDNWRRLGDRLGRCLGLCQSGSKKLEGGGKMDGRGNVIITEKPKLKAS